MNNRKPRGFAYRTGQTDRGFTLIELVIAIVLSGLIAGVVVAALITSLNAADSTTAQVNDSTDTGLVSTFLVRDAQSSGGIDPATAQPVAATLGVSKSDWGGCAQSAALVVRFSWLDHASALARSTIVVTYAYDGSSQTLTRRTCTNGAAGADVVLGRHLKSAVATCHVDNQILDANCTARHPISVSLALTGSGERAPLSATLNAALRTARSQLTITRRMFFAPGPGDSRAMARAHKRSRTPFALRRMNGPKPERSTPNGGVRSTLPKPIFMELSSG